MSRISDLLESLTKDKEAFKYRLNSIIGMCHTIYDAVDKNFTDISYEYIDSVYTELSNIYEKADKFLEEN